MLLAENNIPLAFADKLNTLLPNIFPDSKIAKEYKMGKTKASCILNESLAPHFLQETVQIMKNYFYSLSTDGPNDIGLGKITPLRVRLYDSSKSRVDTRFLDMCCTSGQNSVTAATIFQKIDVMIKLQLPWKNCVGFSLDNTSANLGIRNSIKSRVILKNNNCYFMGCLCHIIYNTAHKGSAGFMCNTKFDVEDFCIDIFYYFDKSTKRKNALQGYAEFCDQEYRDILKHINVRWLSLERAVERILLQYSSLSGYFLSENAPKSATNSNGVESEWGGAKRFKRLEKAFKDLMAEVYLYFFSGVLPAFKHTNLLLQREDPWIHLVHSQLNRFLLQLAGQFMRVTEIKRAPQVSDINIDNHNPQEELPIDICTKNILNKLFEDGGISALDKEKFFAGAPAFCSEAFSYGVEKLPIDDSVLKQSIFADISKRKSVSIDDVFFFVEKFHLNFNPETINLLSEPFLDNQLLNDHDIPDSVWQNAYG